MDTVTKLIKIQSLEKLYNKLAEERKIYAPYVTKNNKVEYKYNPLFSELSFEHIQSTLSVKNVVFPKVENILFYNVNKTESEIKDVNIDKISEVVLWGSHPCDNSAYEVLKSIFCWDINDEFFSKRLEKLVVIGLACHKSDNYCFCTSVGLTPDSQKGCDILLKKSENNIYIAEILTEKGKIILDKYPELFEDIKSEKPIITEVKNKFSHEKVTEKLKNAFENKFWVEHSLRCIGCGACAYVCPTCACFDIQDETNGKSGRRYRSWDSCGFGLFTLHTSGHNPREYQSQRWRQRIMHKFSYMPSRNKSLGCVGCGRCSRGCPVDMNISEQLQELQNL